MQKELNPHSQVFTPGISRTELTASASLNPDTEDMELIIMDNQDSVHIISQDSDSLSEHSSEFLSAESRGDKRVVRAGRYFGSCKQ